MNVLSTTVYRDVDVKTSYSTDTRRRPARVFAAAAEVCASRGIGAATIEQITDAAGLSRGAFCSNFADRDDLLASMLDDHRNRLPRNGT